MNQAQEETLKKIIDRIRMIGGIIEQTIEKDENSFITTIEYGYETENGFGSELTRHCSIFVIGPRGGYRENRVF